MKLWQLDKRENITSCEDSSSYCVESETESMRIMQKIPYMLRPVIGVTKDSAADEEQICTIDTT